MERLRCRQTLERLPLVLPGLAEGIVGMSRGGEYAYAWATANSAKVSCIYADNPGVNPDVLKKLGDLAAADVPVLHVCGSIDPLLERSSTTIEKIYQQFGGRISVMIKEGSGHHPHSLRDPKPIADFIAQSVQPAENGGQREVLLGVPPRGEGQPQRRDAENSAVQHSPCAPESSDWNRFHNFMEVAQDFSPVLPAAI